MTLIFLILACFLAAFVDAVAGGGGLISLPAYFIAGFPSHMALGTNKFASMWGSLVASIKFAKEKKIDFSLIKWLLPMSLLGAVLGVKAVLLVDSNILAPLVMFMILIVGLYSLFSKNLGLRNSYSGSSKKAQLLGMLLALVLGFYDGFFGPGTGTFLVFAMIKIFKFDFLLANANAKPLNLASNFASLITFALNGKILYLYGIPIAFTMMLGGYIGAKASIKNGSRLIKPLFVLMSIGAFAKLISNYF